MYIFSKAMRYVKRMNFLTNNVIESYCVVLGDRDTSSVPLAAAAGADGAEAGGGAEQPQTAGV